MEWNFDDNRPIYLQIVEQIKMMIISGKYQPGAKLDSVRELASDAKVNPNTMQKALSELERINLVFANRTTGRFITDNEKSILNLKSDFAKQKIKEFFVVMNQLGFNKQETQNLIAQFSEGGKINE